jgi:hypothetical protein
MAMFSYLGKTDYRVGTHAAWPGSKPPTECRLPCRFGNNNWKPGNQGPRGAYIRREGPKSLALLCRCGYPLSAASTRSGVIGYSINCTPMAS